jgi:hypothetical protein
MFMGCGKPAQSEVNGKINGYNGRLEFVVDIIR